MNRRAGLLVVALLCALPVCAQDTPQPSPDTSTQTAPAATPSTSSQSSTSAAASKSSFDSREPAAWEISAGFALRNYSTDTLSLKMDGGYLSVNYNILSWLGVGGEGSAVFKQQGTQSLGTREKWALFTGLAGPKVYPFHHHKVTPFAHFLIGVGYYDLSVPAFGGFPSSTSTSTALAYEIGGGLDLRIKRHWAVRLIQGGFDRTAFYGGNPNQGGYRLSTGIVYLWGQK